MFDPPARLPATAFARLPKHFRGLVVAHAGLCVWCFDRLGQPTHQIDTPFPTNIAFGGPENRSLFITESGDGCIMRAELPVAGLPLISHS